MWAWGRGIEHEGRKGSEGESMVRSPFASFATLVFKHFAFHVEHEQGGRELNTKDAKVAKGGERRAAPLLPLLPWCSSFLSSALNVGMGEEI